MEIGEGWGDAVSKILRMGTNNPETNQILSKAKKEPSESDRDSDSDTVDNSLDRRLIKNKNYATLRMKPVPQTDALLENDLKAIATRGVVHLFNAVKTVNPKSDKKRKKKKKKTKKRGKLRRRY